MAFLEIDGECAVRELAPGEILKVDTGSVAAYEQSVQMDIEAVRASKTFLRRRRLVFDHPARTGQGLAANHAVAQSGPQHFPYLPIPRQE